MSQVSRRSEVGNHKWRSLNTRLSSGTSAGTSAVSAGPYRNYHAKAGTKNEPWHVFGTISKKGLENRSSRFEPKNSWLSFSRGSGPPFLPDKQKEDRKVLWITFNSFLRSSLNSPSLIAAEQYAHCSGGKINFWSHLGRGKAENPQKFYRNPSRGCIESNKSAGKRSQQVTLIMCPRHFLEKLISCRIYIPRNAILQVNPLETSLKFCYFFLFAIFCCY